VYPHRIRLLGPWECEPLAPALPARRFVPPGRLRDVGLSDFAGQVRLTRRFGYPGRIDSYEHVWLTFAAVAGHAAVALNDISVAAEMTGSGEFEVTSMLAARNRLEVVVDATNGEGGLPGEIALEVRRDAFLRKLAVDRDAGGEIHITGQVVGQSSQPLELYALANRRNVAYGTIEARPEGQPFTLAFKPEEPVDLVRVELVCVAECWYAAELHAGG
jgi:hypothetical protein